MTINKVNMVLFRNNLYSDTVVLCYKTTINEYLKSRRVLEKEIVASVGDTVWDCYVWNYLYERFQK